MKNELKMPSSLPEGWRKTPEGGLTSAEAAKRKRNIVPRDDGKPTARIITENVFTLFNGLNLLLAAALILVGSYRNMLFLGVVITNTGIAIIQEIRARNTIRKMKLLNAPRVHVIRDGREIELTPEETVEGDLAVFRGGDQIAADCIAVSGAGRAMESLLTGESNDIPKQEGDWLYSGSFLTEGRVTGQMVYVGEESYVGRLTKEAQQQRRPESGLMLEMRRLIRWDTMALLPLGLALFLKQTLWQKLPMASAVPSTVAAMLGMIPEGLMLLTSAALAVGIVRLARKQVLVQELYSIENLARVDTLCLDKTGTLTTGKMRVESVIPLEESEGYARAALSRFLGAFDEKSGTLNALRAAVAPGTEIPLAVQPFSSARKKSAASFAGGKTLILGAPEYVLQEDYPEELRTQVNALAREGKRVVILAEGEGLIEGDRLPSVRRKLALFALSDELRPHVEETTAYFRQEGVTLKVISGDNPETVSRVARTAGLVGWDASVDARELTDESRMLEACEKYTVFGRVTPEQKKLLIEALKKKGHTVAMTGDGVNDIPALRMADCSIAMAEGSDATRHAAQLTLLNSDFASVPDIVLEGRRVINNITRSASLFLTKTVFSFLLSLLTLVSPGTYPFQPIQMSLVSACTVGIPGFLLAMERSRERIRGRFLRTVLRNALPGGVAVALCATLAMLLTHAGWTAETCSTLATWIAALIGTVVLARACWPLNPARVAITAGAMGLFVLCAVTFGHIFLLTRLKGTEWAVLSGLAALGIGSYFLTDWLARKKEKKAKDAGASKIPAGSF